MKIFRLLACACAFSALAVLNAQPTRLSNLSVRAQSGGGEVLITGFTIGAGEDKTVLVRAIGPALAAFGVEGVLADPKIELFRGSTKLTENDNFTAADAVAFTAVGAFQLPAGGKDAALVAKLSPGGYSVQVTGVGGSRGVALVEVYEVGEGGTRLVNLSTRAQVGTGGNVLIPGITISAGSIPRRLLIRAVGPTLSSFGVPGTLADPKLELFSGATKLAENDNWEVASGNGAAGAVQLTSAFSQVGAFNLAPGSKDAALLTNLAPGSYTLQVSGIGNTTGEALVEVYDLTDAAAPVEVKPNSNLYFASVRPGPNSGSSTASGFASISINADGTATVDVNISNLSSAQTAAYLRLAGTGDYILRLPTGQVAQRIWDIGPVGIYSRSDIITALNEGRLYISLETAKYPGGEVAGTLAPATGSVTFAPPAAAPALPPQVLSSPSDVDAARLLLQATFGPTDATLAEVKQLGVNGWLKAQMALPATSLLAGIREDVAKFPNPLKDFNNQDVPRADMFFTHNHAWWKLSVTAPDQLRHRVAFALSEFFVLASDEQSRTEPFAHYYDMLASNAFGNFRTLIDRVSTHPEMGWYLTFLRNQKADPVKGTSPDENYAREVQQLFTIGLVQLQPDGTLLLDAQGRPIATYDNITITETAKVFTGWAYQNRSNNFFSDPAYDGTPGGFSYTALYADANGRMQPLICYDAYHDKTEKRVISLQQKSPREAAPTVIPAGQTGPADLKVLLDTLFAHPNTGPFIARHLIQRLVTSNPSTGYVYRVAQVFANNGSGVRGDLGAVVTAILTDYEARSSEVASNVGYGKIKEPLLRATALLRALQTSAPNGRMADTYYYDARSGNGYYPTGFFSNFSNAVNQLGQAAFHAPSVFNFFSAYYTAPGLLADAGLVAPEMQITDSTFAIKVPNTLTGFIYKEPPVVANAPTPSPFLRNNFSSFLELSPDAAALVERMNLLFCGGQMTAATKAIILETVQAIPVAKPLTNTVTPPTFAVNGGSSTLVAPKVAAFDPTGPYTIEAWVFPTTLPDAGSTWIMGKVTDVGVDPFRLFGLTLRADGTNKNKVAFDSSTGVTGSNRGVTSPNALPIGAWTHVAGTYDGTTMRLYVNGTQVGTATPVGPPKAEPLVPFSVGNGIRANGSGAWTAMNGYISQPRFWNVARTAAQIAKAMNEIEPSEKPGLVGGWPLGEGSGSTAADYSGNNHTLVRPEANASAIAWVPLNGQGLDRTQMALHLTLVSPDAALQK